MIFFVITKTIEQVPEYLVELDIYSGKPKWSKQVKDAQLWESKLYATAQAQLLIRHGVLSVQQEPIGALRAVLG